MGRKRMRKRDCERGRWRRGEEGEGDEEGKGEEGEEGK